MILQLFSMGLNVLVRKSDPKNSALSRDTGY